MDGFAADKVDKYKIKALSRHRRRVPLPTLHIGSSEVSSIFQISYDLFKGITSRESSGLLR